MPTLTKRQVDMTDMIVCNEEIQLFLSKPQLRTALKPEFGQEVILNADVAINDQTISVFPLVETIRPNTVLNFEPGNGNGSLVDTVTVLTRPMPGDTTIKIQSSAVVIDAYNIATTTGNEQTLELANSVAASARQITLVSPLVTWIEKGRELTFLPSGVTYTVSVKAEQGDTQIQINRANTPIPLGEVFKLKNYLEVCSINQLDDSSSANTLNERNFKSGSGTGKAVTSYNDTITIGGNYIKGDFALNRLYTAKQDPTLRGYIIHAVIVEPEGGQDQYGKVWLGQHGNQRPNDQTKKISATLEVDGILYDTKIPRSLLY